MLILKYLKRDACHFALMILCEINERKSVPIMKMPLKISKRQKLHGKTSIYENGENSRIDVSIFPLI